MGHQGVKGTRRGHEAREKKDTGSGTFYVVSPTLPSPAFLFPSFSLKTAGNTQFLTRETDLPAKEQLDSLAARFEIAVEQYCHISPQLKTFDGDILILFLFPNLKTRLIISNFKAFE